MGAHVLGGLEPRHARMATRLPSGVSDTQREMCGALGYRRHRLLPHPAQVAVGEQMRREVLAGAFPEASSNEICCLEQVGQ
jgi:hypothetical protein